MGWRSLRESGTEGVEVTLDVGGTGTAGGVGGPSTRVDWAVNAETEAPGLHRGGRLRALHRCTTCRRPTPSAGGSSSTPRNTHPVTPAMVLAVPPRPLRPSPHPLRRTQVPSSTPTSAEEVQTYASAEGRSLSVPGPNTPNARLWVPQLRSRPLG